MRTQRLLFVLLKANQNIGINRTNVLVLTLIFPNFTENRLTVFFSVTIYTKLDELTLDDFPG
ncbi:hypothetical protein BJP37_14105 [Moorena bouillonii PNG]|uniref:Uncharacterized protein n=1 Tax=Moorena bouillonii PNG TaxID=568701 RepID=A0A1U7N215_9CYAN|nr:hypothetical protein BJP37_14105 [Moorena bouillonii PNG]